MGSSALPLILLLMSFISSGLTEESETETDDETKTNSSIKDEVKVTPDQRVFREETLTCDVQGAGTDTQWTYSWFRDGSVIRDATERVYSITSVSYSGEYSCRGERSDISAAVTLTVSVTHAVKVTPDQRVFRGETVTLTCDIQRAGDIQWRYSWFKDGSVIKNVTKRVYSITSDGSDLSQYRCEAQTSDTTAAVHLTVAALPTSTLTVTPDRSVFTGERVNLKCVIESDHSDWRYEWFKDSAMSQTSDRYTVNTDTLSIIGVTTSDQGYYRCKGHIDGRSVSTNVGSAVYLSVTERPKPVARVHPDRRVFRGETVTLTCHIQQTGVWQYSWYKDNKQVYRAGQNQNYIISSVDPSHGGVYSCKGTQSEAPTHTQMSDGVTLTVSDKPRPTLTVNPESSVFTGDTVTLSCDVEQLTGWTIHWSKDSNTDSRGDATKTIRSVRVSDGGNYWCRAKRGNYYSEYSYAAVITVTERPKPVARVHPDRRVFRGETVTLTCHIQQTGVWQYSWNKDSGQVYSAGQNQNYIISSVDPSHGGVYSCRGTQSEAPTYTQKSDGVTLTVSDKPRPTLTVKSQSSVFTGDTVTLSCDVGQLTGWTIIWRKDSNTDSTGDATKTIWFVRVSDGGRYWCRAKRGNYYSEYSNTAVITVTERPKPVARVHPDRRVFRGETVTLTCHIQQTGVWQYSWYKDSGQVYRAGQNQNYIISSVDPSHGGVYSCRGTQRKAPTYTQKSDGVTLTVSDKLQPTLTVKSQSSVFTGDTVTLSCDVGQLTGWTIIWRKDSNTDSTGDATKTIRSVSVSDGGNYWCIAKRGNYYSEYSNTAVITVKERPKPVARVDPDRRVFRGETVTLTCHIQQTGVWQYSWYKDNKQVYSAGQNQNYIISSVDPSHGGVYSCRGSQSEAPTHTQMSDGVTLTVSDKPRPTLTVKSQSSVFTGDTVTLSCDVGQLTGWTIIWRKDSNTDSTGDATKTIRSVSVSDGGRYWCRAKRGNYYSEYSYAAVITVKERPKPVVDVDPDRCVFRGETVTLTCHIQQTGVWQYSWNKDNKLYRAGQNQNYIISSVDPSHGGVYSCRGSQSEAPTHSQMSDGVTLTVSDKPRPTLTVKSQSSVFTGDTVTLSCDVGQLTGWTIIWRKDSNTDSTGDATKTIRSVSVSDGGNYWCIAKRGNYYSEYSNTAVITVKERPKPVARVDPDRRVFRGETVTLTCHIQQTGVWQYSWYKGSGRVYRAGQNQNYIISSVYWSHGGVYRCRGTQSEAPTHTQKSDGVTLTVSDLKPKPELTSYPAGAALTGNTVTLTCRMDPAAGWDFYWNKHTLNSETKTETNSSRVQIDSESDGGQYWCRAGRGKPVYYTQYSDALWVNVTVSPKAVVTVRPDERVFRGETVALRCDIKWGGDTEWTYRWEIEGTNNQYKNSVSQISAQELNISSVDHVHSGKYTCRGQKNTQCSQRSDAVTLTVSAEARAAVRVSPQPWLTEGDSVTLICEVTGSSTGWTFSWFRDDDRLSDSSRGAAGSYTLSPAALQHTGVYTCRAERGRPAYYTNYTQTLWITGVSPSVSLEVSPSRSQHFSSDSLSLSCEDQSNSAGWTVRRYTDRNTEDCSKQAGSTCRIVSLSTSDSGVYWCQSESGEKRHPLNITVHDGDVILESSVDPVIEGDTLTLHCLHRSTNSSILGADFYKDGSLVQNQTTGEMNIMTVSKSHEGFYSCKTERGASPKSWISVRVSRSGQISVFSILSFLLAACPYLLSTVVLLFKCCRARVTSTEDHSQFSVTEEHTST
ncbi:titin-like isoform X3 [Onychostoma macrolepis]|uniref:titin-like isoform X3 n=1 Tax=Onychostoma macrolepis TaxID=369639 RepID=UPI00272BBA97|nr:titin-like isoform X3 [Onychostoma macrolepis]